MAEKAGRFFPSAITHDSRHTMPYGIYVESAYGSRKQDVDGNEYVDYFGGHGALMLGHRNAEVEACIQEALAAGTHFGSSHHFEVDWAEAVQITVKVVSQHWRDNHDQRACQLLFVVSITRRHQLT